MIHRKLYWILYFPHLPPTKYHFAALIGEVWCSHLQCLNDPSSSLCSRAENDPKLNDIKRSSEEYKTETSRNIEKQWNASLDQAELDQFCKVKCSESLGEGQSDGLLQPACCEAKSFKLAPVCHCSSLGVVLTGMETIGKFALAAIPFLQHHHWTSNDLQCTRNR